MGWEERLRNDLFCVKWNVIHINSISQRVHHKVERCAVRLTRLH